jgi:uncharacterized SAM-binding protein YcdF (DUF218 family)
MSCRDKKSNFLKRSPNRRSISVLILGLFLISLLIALLGVPGSWLLRPLETRFPVRRQAPTDQVTGIVLLGGFHLDSRVASELNSNVASELDSRAASERFDIRSGLAERVMETVRLSKLYPDARILYSGGGVTEAQLGKKVLMRLGVERERIIIEDRSRNTAENAGFSKIIAAPKPLEKWLLVTSAFHMPRAMGAFRAVGFPVEADPVHFQSSKADLGGRKQAVLALREYIALFKYWLSGQSNELFPSP